MLERYQGCRYGGRTREGITTIKANMLIPMAGEGRRFKSAGYNLPKPLLDINGMPMIGRIIENLYDDRLQFIFCVQKQHIKQYSIDKILKQYLPECHVVEVSGPTQGPVCTCLLSERIINTDTPLFITNSDQIIEDWSLDKFLHFCDEHDPDGVVGTYESQSPKNSYIKLSDDGIGIELREKEIISEHATNGLHYWKSGNMFTSASAEMIACNDTTNGEYYVAPTYNYMIKRGLKVMPYRFARHYPIGIPSDFESYISYMNTKEPTT